MKITEDYYYPDVKVPQFLAYGFRPILLILPFYIVLNMALWALMWQGIIPIEWLDEPIKWHIFELLFGVGSASLVAFILTALPELFLGVLPIVGRPLVMIVMLWILGRISFWLNLGVTNGILNVSLMILLIAIAFKPIVFDPLRKYTAIAITMIGLTILEICYFSNYFDGMKILIFSIHIFMILILLALRRVNTEAINFYLEDRGIDETFYARSFRYNVAIIAILLYTFLDYFDENNLALSWLAFASMAGIFGILSDLKMKNYFILHYAYVIYLSTIIILMALGYGFLGYAKITGDFGLNNFIHLLTSGAFGLSIFLTACIMVQIHTGRHLVAYKGISIGVFLIILATILRVSIEFYPDYSSFLYPISAILWTIPFGMYFFMFKDFLLGKRADGLPG